MTICLSGCSLVQGGKVILQDVSLQLAAGEVISVVGPNGAGKSSLVALVAATSQPSSGQLSLDGRPYGSISLAERATRVAVLPQQTSLEFPFSVAEVIQLGRIPHGGGRHLQSPMLAEIMGCLALYDLRNRIYTSLSGGEKQRTQIARVLCQLWDRIAGSYFIFDEPTAALDIGHQLVILRLLRDLADRGAGVLVVMHDINLAARCGDRLLLLKAGQVLGLGKPAEVLTAARVTEAFGVMPQRLLLDDGSLQWVFVE
jgi:iron complex transport system ATP-binding protein